MARLDMDVLLEKTITDEVIERKIRDDTRRILEEMSKARHDPNVERLARDYDGLYMEESEMGFMGATMLNLMTALHNPRTGIQEPDGLSKEHLEGGANYV
ncbi:hypothetical protein Syun_001281 [Stephania yunnanensis]|uniref:Uncharacterized protein n=1 Tax=Stephania yunnanensis TaxID=152371 RepID=A0AAP0LDT3_9MAGN